MIATAKSPVLYWILCDDGKAREVYMESHSRVYFRIIDSDPPRGGVTEKFFMDIWLERKRWDVTRNEKRMQEHIRKFANEGR